MKLRHIKKNKKGFTLVELIVVLVILAILIALLIPTLTGYIDRANKKSAHADLKIIATAARSAYAEVYSEHTGDQVIYSKQFGWGGGGESDQEYSKEFLSLLGSDVDFDNITQLSILSNGKNLAIKYTYKSVVYTYHADENGVKITP